MEFLPLATRLQDRARLIAGGVGIGPSQRIDLPGEVIDLSGGIA
jgi:hypothetical protein